MNRNITGTRTETGERRLPALGIACALGALLGSLCCSRMNMLQDTLQRYLESRQTVWQFFLPECVLLLLMLTAGFLRTGFFLALFTVAVKGFYLSAAATLGVMQLGNHGYLQILSVWFLPGFVSMTALLLLGRQAMGWASVRARLPVGRKKPVLPDGTYYVTAAICLGILLLSALLSVRVAPGLWNAVQSFLPMR